MGSVYAAAGEGVVTDSLRRVAREAFGNHRLLTTMVGFLAEVQRAVGRERRNHESRPHSRTDAARVAHPLDRAVKRPPELAVWVQAKTYDTTTSSPAKSPSASGNETFRPRTRFCLTLTR